MTEYVAEVDDGEIVLRRDDGGTYPLGVMFGADEFDLQCALHELNELSRPGQEIHFNQVDWSSVDV